MEEKLKSIKQAAMPLILEAKNLEELEEIRVQFLGKKGSLTLALKDITSVPKEHRQAVGKQANEVKSIIEDALSEAKSSLHHQGKHEQTKRFSGIDVTEPGIRPPLGHLHLITQAIFEITTIFERIGFSKVRYPEIEWDFYAFGSLNFPENHPARDDWETFFIDQKPHPKKGPVLLTPHTSSGQVREMERHSSQNTKSEYLPAGRQGRNSKQIRNTNVKNTKHFEHSNLGYSDIASDFVLRASNLNIKMLNIAKCYRRQSDVSHTPMFHQFEGLVVGENISITHLKGTLDHFVKSYFGEERVSRIRPYHFQFTEPSFEVDVSCGICNGKGILRQARDGKEEPCRLCKEGWLELGGAGMVHPNVLKAGGIDPTKHTGFAFGWGVERVLMMKEGLVIDDLRLLYSNKLEFLEQF